VHAFFDAWSVNVGVHSTTWVPGVAVVHPLDLDRLHVPGHRERGAHLRLVHEVRPFVFRLPVLFGRVAEVPVLHERVERPAGPVREVAVDRRDRAGPAAIVVVFSNPPAAREARPKSSDIAVLGFTFRTKMCSGPSWSTRRTNVSPGPICVVVVA